MQAVRDIMTTEVVTLDPDMTLREAAATLADHHVSGAPVIANGRVVGVLSASDILDIDALGPLGEGPFNEDELSVDDDEPAPFFARLWPDAAMDVRERFRTARESDRIVDRSPLDDHSVSDAMTRSVLEIRPDAPIAQAAGRMADACVHRLLVVEDGGLAGIVTTTDIARWLAGRLR